MNPNDLSLALALPGTETPWVAAPIITALGTALLLLIPMGRNLRALIAVLGTLVMLGASAYLVSATAGGAVLSSSMGAWPAPFGIVMVADRLGAWMSLLTGVSALMSVLYAAFNPDRVREKYGLFALLHFLFAGVQMSFLTGDLFNLFVAFEVMLVASYALAVLGSTREQLREGFRYIVMNLSASALLVVTCGLIYGQLGTLNMAHLAQRSAELGAVPAVTALSVLLLMVFASKSALFPLGFWLPGTYPAVPPAVGAFFAAILTKVGVYALARTFNTIFVAEPDVARNILLALGTVTMLYGALGILSQREWRRVLAFSVVASVGYLAFGLGIGTPAALSATMYYMAVSILVTTAMFLLAGVAERDTGTPYIAVRGMLEHRPLLAAAFMFGALTIAGLPPTGGFIAKFALVQAALAAGGPLVYLGVFSALASSLIILYAMLNIWRTFFWGKQRSERALTPPSLAQAAPMYLAMLGVVGTALLAGPMTRLTAAMGQELQTPQHYIGGVLGDRPVVIPPAPTEAYGGKGHTDAGHAEQEEKGKAGSDDGRIQPADQQPADRQPAAQPTDQAAPEPTAPQPEVNP
ncbi:NADH dehydrogenase (quinone) [Deinococcus proteolyticus MRP]|uniref:NADH dehydrogenase (Quinone) n=1 Tax=Deinococcus proteolyticus (strain ATCC 35074 / DSM 20540 / JCM 6276 / NBRC 101906 / NCIMB 13154 / VKM Ac-1939 / CCM 2703 / MRP) TaxID=693977 RepID=F0RJ51_DEIPM|nr:MULTISPECIES: proton-conducting transporter membrane subunit [Deinococcus]ADY25459.1 NADH dehydrogenase (quinone) [Deinococcus proteolyticus MRP]MCY1701580.1 proton-conducting transporter membrane subunit [Deinococcus sp. SL84]